MLNFDKVPMVSVLMPCYNSSRFLSIAIESVLASTYGNFELIITDDNSTDDTFSIAKGFQSKDDRIKLFRNEQNYGDYGNRNKAASYAVGKYLKFVDHDDFIYPNGLELIVNQMEMYSEASLGFFALEQNKHTPFPIMLTPKEIYEYNFFGPGLFFKAPLSTIILRSSFEAAGGFKTNRYTGDFELWHRMGQKYNFLLIQDHVVWYREHDNQESNTMDFNTALNYNKIEMDYIIDINSPLTDDDRRIILKKRIKSNLRQFMICFLKFKFLDAIMYLHKSSVYLKWRS